MDTPPLTREMARFASHLELSDIPHSVRRLVQSQTLSVLAAAHASRHLGRVSEIFSKALLQEDASDADALFANAALSMALDYDDYLFMGHTGHSAIWVPLLLGSTIDADPKEVVCAMVVGNEVGGRLGAACLFGPHNGQMWSYVHLASAACAAARLMRLDEDQTANALGIAFSQPPYPLLPGFMGPDTKLLTASTPAVIGLRATQLARAGLSGARDILEAKGGFLDRFSFLPLTHLLSGYGTAWVTETLAIKPYPGCAYIGTTIDVVRDLARTIRAEEVASVTVHASLLTIEMDRMSQSGEEGPIQTNFSIPMNVAITLLDGDLSAAAFGDRFLERLPELRNLARRVTLVHDPELTNHTLRTLDEQLGLDRLLGEQRLSDLTFALRAMAKQHGRELRDLASLRFSHSGILWRILRRALRVGRAPWERSPFLRSTGGLDDIDFARVRMPFGARVEIALRDGRVMTGERMVPRGAGADREQVAEEKWLRESALSEDQSRAVLQQVASLEQTAPGSLLEQVGRSVA